MGNTLFFRADDGQFGAELWRSDGTPEGTMRVADINPTGSGDPIRLTAIGSTLYFTATDGTTGYELWKSDGTESGTHLIRDINPGTESSSPWRLVGFQGKVFFSARPSGYYDELWVSDGTSAGTYSLAKTSLMELPTVVGDTLYFRSFDGALGTQNLWATDGTAQGTQRLGPFGLYAAEPRELIDAGGTLFVAARGALRRDNQNDGFELWKSDGTFEGTVQLSDINRPVDSIRQDAEYNRIVDLNGVAYFGTASGLWRTDGTAGGTSLVAPILSRYLTRLGDRLISAGSAGPSGGVGLWASDGMPTGTTFIKQINSVANVSLVGDFTQVGSLLYFVADDGEFGKEVWRTDGTADGTFRLTDIRAGKADTNPSLLTNINGQLVFVVGDGSGNSQIWRSDGTVAGTMSW